MIVFRKAAPTEKTPWPLSATSFSSVTDGIANTLMIVEKHLRREWLGGELDEPALVALADQNSIRVGGDIPSRGVARSANDPDSWSFGSWHPIATMFAMGDASVRPIRNTIDPPMLKALLSRDNLLADPR